MIIGRKNDVVIRRRSQVADIAIVMFNRRMRIGSVVMRMFVVYSAIEFAPFNSPAYRLAVMVMRHKSKSQQQSHRHAHKCH